MTDSPSPEPVANMKSGDSQTGPGAWLQRLCVRFDRLFSLDHNPARQASDEYDEAFHDAVHALKDLRQFSQIIAPTWTAAASPSIQSSPPASEITEAIETMTPEQTLMEDIWLAGFDHAIRMDGHDAPANKCKKCLAARSQLETLYREQQQEIERLREDVPTEEEVRVLLRSLSEGPPSRVLNSAILRLQRIKRGSRK